MTTDTAPLRQLWQQAFGDPEEFVDAFFRLAYSPDRCRCLYEKGRLAAMLYWFDCSLAGKKIAYLYGVATEEAFRKQGLCRHLMEDTHRHLEKAGYAGCVLVPRGPELFAMYEKMGYRTCCHIRAFPVKAETPPISMKKVSVPEYALLRRDFLPQGSVIQEGAALQLLNSYATFYRGDGFLLAAHPENGKLTICELLGKEAAASGILAALGYQEAIFRSPGSEIPFAMYHSLDGTTPAPQYFGLALD